MATARVVDVQADPAKPDHYYERQLRRDDGRTSKGAFGRAVRILSEDEYEDILRAGFAHELGRDVPQRDPAMADPASMWALADDPGEFERPIVERVMSRPVRDAAFARVIQAAYGATCAVTGIKIINGGGRAEVQAAHIKPVKDRGPDSVRNGIALSGTVHWMFDRGLISFGPPPDYEILVTSKGLPENVLSLLNPGRRLRRPTKPELWPAPAYLDHHRSRVFKA